MVIDVSEPFKWSDCTEIRYILYFVFLAKRSKCRKGQSLNGTYNIRANGKDHLYIQCHRNY